MPDLPGQLLTRLAGGRLALVCSKTIEDGARAALLLAPGLFRLDVTPQDDTLKLQVRNLSDGPCEWSEGGRPHVIVQLEGPAVSAHALHVDVAGRRAKVIISARREPGAPIMHLVAQADVAAHPPTAEPS